MAANSRAPRARGDRFGGRMTRRVLLSTCLALAMAAPAWAQQPGPTLSPVFEDLFGPNGLRVDTEAGGPGGSSHSGHFNRPFQANSGELAAGLPTPLPGRPRPSPASCFPYRFDPSTGTFVRTAQSFGPILT